MDTPLPDDFDPAEYLRGDMQIHGDIPRSTLAIAAVLWSILFAMQAWHLITTLNMKDKQTEQGGDIRVMTVQQDRVAEDIRELKEIVGTHERRLNMLEGRR